MSGAMPPLPQYAFMAWCSVKAQGQIGLNFTLRKICLWYLCQFSGVTLYNRFIHLLNFILLQAQKFVSSQEVTDNYSHPLTLYLHNLNNPSPSNFRRGTSIQSGHL